MYESKKLSIQDILERRDRQMEAKALKIKQENEKLNALILKKTLKGNPVANNQVKADVGAYNPIREFQPQINYQPTMFQFPNIQMNQGLQGQNSFTVSNTMPFNMANTFNSQGGQVNYNNLMNTMNDPNYSHQTNGQPYNHNPRGPNNQK